MPGMSCQYLIIPSRQYVIMPKFVEPVCVRGMLPCYYVTVWLYAMHEESRLVFSLYVAMIAQMPVWLIMAFLKVHQSVQSSMLAFIKDMWSCLANYVQRISQLLFIHPLHCLLQLQSAFKTVMGICSL